MNSQAPVVLILGAGPGIGAGTAQLFAANGFRLALSSRSFDDEQKDPNELHVKVDLSQPETVPMVFEKVMAAFGTPPSVVVYNGASWSFGNPNDPLADFDPTAFQNEFNTNATSVGVAAKCAVEGFRRLPTADKKTFILTGNSLPTLTVPKLIALSATKTAGYKIIAGAWKGYEPEGFRFYFVDERSAEGGPAMPPNGPAHAQVFLKLANSDRQEELFYSFVKSSSEYVDFGQPKNSA